MGCTLTSGSVPTVHLGSLPNVVLVDHVFQMNVGVAHSEVNPNTRVMNSRGIWLTYLLLTVVLHIILLSIPFFTVPLVWTLTNVIHNLVSSCYKSQHYSTFTPTITINTFNTVLWPKININVLVHNTGTQSRGWVPIEAAELLQGPYSRVN